MTFICLHGLLRHEPLCLAMTVGRMSLASDLFKFVIASLRSNLGAGSDVYFELFRVITLPIDIRCIICYRVTIMK